jgi:hypothetical protein
MDNKFKDIYRLIETGFKQRRIRRNTIIALALSLFCTGIFVGSTTAAIGISARAIPSLHYTRERLTEMVAICRNKPPMAINGYVVKRVGKLIADLNPTDCMAAIDFLIDRMQLYGCVKNNDTTYGI